ncbi:MAG: radical SAM protein [Proteobacteria bacterium]|nr:radical SAM protein [Pseudomonadota bacterium]
MIFENYWPAYFLVYYIKCRIFKKKSPILAGFKITHACNLQCTHCPFWSKAGTGSLPYEKIVHILKALNSDGVRIIIIEGGEPFLWRDGAHTIYDVVEEAKKLFFSVGMITNGTFPLDIPTDALWVSIDGRQKTHNRIRGACFEQILQHIDRSSHPNLLANVTINKLNCRDIPELVKYLSRKVKGITVQFYYPYDGDTGLCVSPQERGEVLRQLIQLKQDGYPVSDSFDCLESLVGNTWQCEDWMLANVEPDGRINSGCYVKNRGEINCGMCGFAAHTEMSRAFQLRLEPFLAGKKIFNYRNLTV